MFGAGAGLLSRLLGRGGGNAVNSRYGAEIASGLSRQYGDDVASSLMAKPSATPAMESGSKLSQLLYGGVPDTISINPNLTKEVTENSMLYNATTKALPKNDTFGAKVTNAGKSLEEAGTKLRNSSLLGTVRDPRQLERANKAIKFADEVGLPKNQYRAVSEVITGKDGLFSTMNRNVLDHSDVSVHFPSTIREKALKAIDDIPTLEATTARNLKTKINNVYDSLNNKAFERVGTKRPVAATGEAFIADIHKEVQALGEIANRGTGKDASVVRRIFNSFKNDMEDAIESAGNMSGYSDPDNINALVEGIKGANLPPKLQLKYINGIRDEVAKNGGLSYKWLRRQQADPVMLGQIADMAETAPLAGGVGYNRGMLSGPTGQIIDEVIGKPLASGVGKTMQMAGRAGQMAGQGQFNGALNNLGTAGAVGLGGIGALNLLGAGGGRGQDGVMPPDIDPTVGGDMVNPAMAGAMGAGAMGAGSISAMAGEGGGMSPMGEVMPDSGVTVAGYNRDQLEQAYLAALMDDNLKAAQAIGTMLGMLDDKEAGLAKEEDKTGANDGKIDSALNVVDSLEGLYRQFGGAQGIIGGNVTNTLNSVSGGAFNSEVAAYNDSIQGSLAPIIKAMGDSGTLSDSDMKRATSFIPSVTDDPKKAEIKFRMLKELLNQARQGA